MFGGQYGRKRRKSEENPPNFDVYGRFGPKRDIKRWKVLKWSKRARTNKNEQEGTRRNKNEGSLRKKGRKLENAAKKKAAV